MKNTKVKDFSKTLRLHMVRAVVCMVLSLFGETLGVVTMFVGLAFSDRFCIIAGLLAILGNVWWYICANESYKDARDTKYRCEQILKQCNK